MKKIFYLLALTAGLFACQKEEMITTQPILKDSYHATIESHSSARSYMGSDFQFYWHNGDPITICTPAGPETYEYVGATGTTDGDFIPTYDSDTTTYTSVVAVYPQYLLYDNETTPEMFADGSAIIYFSADNGYIEEGELIGREDNPMVAVTSGGSRSLSFQNICGYLMLQLYGDNIEVASVRIAENNPSPHHGFSGKFKLTATASGEPQLTPIPEEEREAWDGYTPYAIDETIRTLGCSKEEATPILFALPPRMLAKGFRVTVTTTDGRIFERATTKPVNIERNKILPMSPIKVTPADPHNITSEVDNFILSSEAQTISFNAACESYHNTPCNPTYKTTVIEGASWLTLSSQDGDTFTYSATANTTGKTRIGAIVIYDADGYSTRTIGIAQSGLTATEYEAFSIVGTWRQTGFRDEEMDSGRFFIEEETFGEDFVDIYTFRADGTGTEDWVEMDYSGSDEFTYSYNKGILTLYYTESWGDETYTWEETYIVDTYSDGGYTLFYYEAVFASIHSNTIEDYCKSWEFYTRYNE